MNVFYEEKHCSPYELHFNEDNMDYIHHYDNSIVLDVIDTFYSVCYLDFYTKRNENNDNSKLLSIEIPVNNKTKLDKIKPELNSLIQFMTNGEKFNISFIENLEKKEIIVPDKLPLGVNYNSIALLSGGLDALAGASQESNNKTLFITYSTNKIEGNKSINSYNNYIRNYCPNSSHIIIPKISLKRKKQLTQRTRSLAFIASCLLYADHFKIKEIKIYENGIMTLNPVFYFRRRVTRTTHPKTLYLVNEILKKLKIDIKVVNPFNYMTKAEVLDLIPNEWNNLIFQTKTCSKMPGTKAFYNRNGLGINHCGICTACILRQISILNSTKRGLDAKYMTTETILSEEKMLKIENQYAYNKSQKYIKSLTRYKYIEKKSLVDYYKIFAKKIDNGEIYNYLYLNPNYFRETPDYLEKYDKLLKKFKKEIENYINNLE